MKSITVLVFAIGLTLVASYHNTDHPHDFQIVIPMDDDHPLDVGPLLRQLQNVRRAPPCTGTIRALVHHMRLERNLREAAGLTEPKAEPELEPEPEP